MNTNVRKGVVAGIIVLAIITLIVGSLLIARFFFSGSPLIGQGWRGRFPLTGSFESNGERIYFSGISETGPPITSEMPGMHRMPSGRMACADCHGADGRGGVVRMMMSSFDAPDIRYSTLAREEHGDVHGDHPPYTDDDIKRAVTQGIDPGGEPLEWMMPRWNMTGEQLEDIISFLKTLE
jgi:cytochrome c oxidase subunit II